MRMSIILLILVFLFSCNSDKKTEPSEIKERNKEKEYSLSTNEHFNISIKRSSEKLMNLLLDTGTVSLDTSEYWINKFYNTAIRYNNLKALVLLDSITNNYLPDSIEFVNSDNNIDLLYKSQIPSHLKTETYIYLINKGIVTFKNREDTVFSIFNAIDNNIVDLTYYWVKHGGMEYANSMIDIDESGELGYPISPIGRALENNNEKLLDILEYNGAKYDSNSIKYATKEMIVRITKQLRKRGIADSLIFKGAIRYELRPYFNKNINLEKIYYLIDLGADITDIDQEGNTLLYHSVAPLGWPCNENLSSRLIFAEYLLEKGLDVNQTCKHRGVEKKLYELIIGGYSDENPIGSDSRYDEYKLKYFKLFVKYQIEIDLDSFYDSLDSEVNGELRKYILELKNKT